MKKTVSTLVMVFSLLTFFNVNAQDLFISEYAEGSGNHKYIEIYNPTSEAISLADYAFARNNNGGNVIWSDIFPDEDFVEAGDVIIVDTRNLEYIKKV